MKLQWAQPTIKLRLQLERLKPISDEHIKEVHEVFQHQSKKKKKNGIQNGIQKRKWKWKWNTETKVEILVTPIVCFEEMLRLRDFL